MTFDFNLLIRAYFKSIFAPRGTGGRFGPKRALFSISFPLWYSFLELTNWTCLFLDEILFPGYRRMPVQEPVFVIGFPRSGTTYLHRLLDNDREQFTSLKLWEIMFAPSIVQKKAFLLLGRFDRSIGEPLHRVAVRLEDRVFSGSRKMHKISHFEPEEDEIILIHIFSSLFLAFMFPSEDMDRFSRFDTDVAPERREKIMRFYRKCVQRHLYVFGPDKHFLSKNPASSSKIESIYAAFPDAKIVCVVRHPFAAVPSAISWISYGFERFNDVDQPALTERILSLISHWYTYPLTKLNTRPEDSQTIERYDELVGDPGEFVRRIYRRFGFGVSGPFAEYLTAETEKAKQYKSRHEYSLDRYGISPDRIVAAFRPIFEKFGFDPTAGRAQ